MNSSASDRPTVTFEVSAFPVEDAVALREEIERTTLPWDECSSPERKAIVGMVHLALTHMRDSIEEWLPEAIVAASHQRFGIFVLWENGTLLEEIIRQEATATEERAQRLADFMRWATSE